MTRPSEYAGERSLVVSATQLGDAYSASAARRVIDEWIEFFASGPSAVRELTFTTRTPARLFASLASQTQLETLRVKWGDYDDLAPLAEMSHLRELELRGASKVDRIDDIGGLTCLATLVIEGFRSIDDPSPLARLSQLKRLELGGNWMSSRNGHIPSLEFLNELGSLETLLLHTLIVDNKDYSPVLALRRLKKVRVMETRGMRPTIEELRSVLPWDA
jgi:hypothetical protein